MRLYRFKEKHGVRLFIGALRVEFYWWHFNLGAGVSRDAEGWHSYVRIAPLSLFVSLEKWPLWTGGRECSLDCYDWTLRLAPFGRKHEWRARDPWWVRGVSVDLRRVVLGKQSYKTEEIASGIACVVPMPEGAYKAVAKIERQTWKRPRWFTHSRTSVWLDIPKGIPHAGKGENSWDCGDDGLFGIGGDSVADAIKRAQDSVLRSRKSYGHASEQAIKEALE